MLNTLRVESLETLQRSNFVPQALRPDTPFSFAPIDRRSLLCISKIGLASREFTPTPGEKIPRPPSENLLIGMTGNSSPLAFLIQGRVEGVAVYLGTWEWQNGALNQHSAALVSALK